MALRQILIADDDEMLRDLLTENLVHEGFDVDAVADGESARRALASKTYELLITDLRMPGVDGIALLRWLQQEQMPTVGIVMTGFGSIDTAIEAMKAGAFHYLTKPLDFAEVKLLVRKVQNFLELRDENVALKRKISRLHPGIEDIVGVSPAMRAIFDMVLTVAGSDSTVLLLGESGTGKEVIARAIHHHSPRADEPLVIVNCAAIPEALLESELFGHAKGAFTGAVSDRKGRFHLADKGTVFLDEIAELSPALQVKLLRVLQEHEFEPVGSNTTVRVDVRIIASTNRDLESLVREGRFREDLYYRLNVIPIHLPPLRERVEDIPALIAHFSDRLAERSGRRIEGFDPEAMNALLTYDWPGNVRELENLMERVVALLPGRTVTFADLPEQIRNEVTPPVPSVGGDEFLAEGTTLPEMVERMESALIRQALRRSDGVRSRAAELLGIKRTTLIQKMKRLGIS